MVCRLMLSRTLGCILCTLSTVSCHVETPSQRAVSILLMQLVATQIFYTVHATKIEGAPPVCTRCHCVRAHLCGVVGPMVTGLLSPLQVRASGEHVSSGWKRGRKRGLWEGAAVFQQSTSVCVKDSLGGLPGLHAPAGPTTVLETLHTMLIATS